MVERGAQDRLLEPNSARNAHSRAGHFNRQNAVYAEAGEPVLPAKTGRSRLYRGVIV
jgi:hypothetical protein